MLDVAVPHPEIPLQEHAAVHADDGQGPVRTLFERPLPVQFVLGEAHPDLGHQESRLGAYRVADGRVQVGAEPGHVHRDPGLAGPVEIGEIRQQVEVDFLVAAQGAVPELQARQVFIGPGGHRDALVDDLVAVQAAQHAPVAPAVGQVRPARQEAGRGNGQVGAEILQVFRVRGPVVIHVQFAPTEEGLVEFDIDHAAVAVAEADVAGQVFKTHPALAPREQVAVFQHAHDAAVGQHPGRDGRIHVGRDIPVIGQPGLKPAVAVLADARREKTGFAVPAQGEGEVGRIEHRDVLDLEDDVPARAAVRVMVERQFPRADAPEVLLDAAAVLRRAGGERHAFPGSQSPGVDEQFVGHAPGIAVGQVVFGAGHGCRTVLDVDTGALAGQEQRFLPELHVTGQVHEIPRVVVHRVVRARLPCVRGHLDGPRQVRDALLGEVDAVSIDVGIAFLPLDVDHRPLRHLEHDGAERPPGNRRLLRRHHPAPQQDTHQKDRTPI